MLAKMGILSIAEEIHLTLFFLVSQVCITNFAIKIFADYLFSIFAIFTTMIPTISAELFHEDDESLNFVH